MITHIDGNITIQRGGLYAVDPSFHENESYYTPEFKTRLGLFTLLGNGFVRVVDILNKEFVTVLPPNSPPGYALPLAIKVGSIYKAKT